MSAAIRKAVIIAYQDKIPTALPLRLEEAGFTVEVRDADKMREATRALPIGCEVVVALGSNAYGNALAEVARKAGAKVFSGSGGARIIAALDAAGVIRASDADAAYIDIGVLGDLTRRQQDEISATVRRWSRGAARVAHWLRRGCGQMTPEKGLNGYIIVSDYTPKEVRQSFRNYLRDVARGKVGNATGPDVDIPCVTARFDDIVKAAGDDNAVLGKWFVQLERAVEKVREQIEETSKPAPVGPPDWLQRQQEREAEQKARWEQERKAAAEREAALAAEIEADHDDATRENVMHDEAARSHRADLQRERMDANIAPLPLRPEPPQPPPEAAAQRAEQPPRGIWIGGAEVVPLAAGAEAIFCDPSTLRGLVDAGKAQAVLINGEPYISYEELKRAEVALAPMMDAESDYATQATRADGLYTADEAARYLGCSAGTVTRKTREGYISRAAKDGKAWLYSRADLDDWRERRKSQATMRRRTGPLGMANAGRSEANEAETTEARAEVKRLADRIQELLGMASYASLSIGPDEITARKVVVEEEAL